MSEPAMHPTDTIYSDESRVFVLGAGFSAHAGFPLVKDVKAEVLDYIRTSEHGYFKEAMNSRGRAFETGLEEADSDGLADFEVLLQDLLDMVRSNSSLHSSTTLELLQVACARVLWARHHETPTLPDAYGMFAQWFKHVPGGPLPAIISFNWDLVAEASLHSACVPAGYFPDFRRGIPIIKPHGSINWSSFVREGLFSDYTAWERIAPGLSVDASDPLGDPDSEEINSRLRYMIFPGDKDDPEGDRDQSWLWKAAAKVIRERPRIVFIGYSLPSYDEYALLFFKNLTRGKTIEVYNPSKEALDRYSDHFGKPIHRFATRFEHCPYGTNPPNEL